MQSSDVFLAFSIFNPLHLPNEEEEVLSMLPKSWILDPTMFALNIWIFTLLDN